MVISVFGACRLNDCEVLSCYLDQQIALLPESHSKETFSD